MGPGLVMPPRTLDQLEVRAEGTWRDIIRLEVPDDEFDRFRRLTGIDEEEASGLVAHRRRATHSPAELHLQPG